MSQGLFSVFEPQAVGGISLNWGSMLCFLVIPSLLSLRTSSLKSFISTVLGALNSNTKETLSTYASPVSGLLLSGLFIWVSLNNFLGLGPYLFTASSHLIFGMSLALPFWVGYMFIYFIYFNETFMSHLIPAGTPVVLVGLMILIESISNIIRPATLMFRLTANMIAGHLLVVLLSGAAVNSSAVVLILVTLSLILLLLLEVSVSFIQAYVFYLLSSLYISDLVASPQHTQTQVLSQSL